MNDMEFNEILHIFGARNDYGGQPQIALQVGTGTVFEVADLRAMKFNDAIRLIRMRALSMRVKTLDMYDSLLKNIDGANPLNELLKDVKV